jgi:hypothetical protein
MADKAGTDATPASAMVKSNAAESVAATAKSAAEAESVATTATAKSAAEWDAST